MKNLLEAMQTLKENDSKYSLCIEHVEYCIKRHLREMFYSIPRIEATTYLEGGYMAEFRMSKSPYNPTSNQIKKWFREDFDLSNYKISVNTFKHPRLTSGDIEFTVYIEPKPNKENLDEVK